MGAWRSNCTDIVLRQLGRLPDRAIRKLDDALQMSQGKGWGTATTKLEARAVRRLLGSRGAGTLVAFDVGANVGAWSRTFLEECPGAIVHAFEPSRVAFDRLKELGTGEDRLVPHCLALAESRGSGTLWTDVPGSGLASLTRRRLEHFKVDFGTSEEVSISTLDEVCLEMSVLPDVVKIDVEGSELDVLRGGDATLRTVSVIQFEFGGCNIDSRTYFQDFWYYFREKGFLIFRLGPAGLRRIDKYSESDEYFRTTNFFAARPPERGVGESLDTRTVNPESRSANASL